MSDYSLLHCYITTVGSFMTALAIWNSHRHSWKVTRSSNMFQHWFCLRLALRIIWTLYLTFQQMAPRAHAALSGSFHPWCLSKQSFRSLFNFGYSSRLFAQFQSSCSNKPNSSKKKKSMDLCESHGLSLRGRKIRKSHPWKFEMHCIT